MDVPSKFETVISELREKLVQGLAAVNQDKLTDGETFFDELDEEDDAFRPNYVRIDWEPT